MRAVIWLSVLVVLGCSGDSSDKEEPTDPPVVDEECVAEIPYDGVDQDCDGEDLVDVDGDGVAGGPDGEDCDDTDPLIYPLATDEVGDDVDNNCDGLDGVDDDSDGVASEGSGGTDCDDTDSSVYPTAIDFVGNDVDENCDSLDGVDADQDGYASTISQGLDCNDLNPSIHPDAVEIWYDSVDQNCDFFCDYDQDHDGFLDSSVPISNNNPCDADPGPYMVFPIDCDDTNSGATDVSFVELSPAMGASYTSVTEINALLSGADFAATMSLFREGFPVAGTAGLDGGTLVFFEPDAELLPGDYEVTLVTACDTTSWEFTVVPLIPIDDINDVTWAIDVIAGNWSQPPGLNGVVGLIGGLEIILGSGTVVGDLLPLTVGIGDGSGEQEECLPTQSFDVDFSQNPVFELVAAELHTEVGGIPIDLEDTLLSGAIVNNGDEILDLMLSATIDTRPLDNSIIGGLTTCNLLATLGISCTACSDGSGDFCLDVVIEDLVAVRTQTPLIPMDDASIAADPTCP